MVFILAVKKGVFYFLMEENLLEIFCQTIISLMWKSVILLIFLPIISFFQFGFMSNLKYNYLCLIHLLLYFLYCITWG